MRKLIPLTLVFAFAYAVLGPLGCGDSSVQSAPAIEHPFRPPTVSIYLLAGQDSEQLGAMPRAGFADGYLDRVPVRPSGISLYGGFPEPNASEGFDSLAWVQTANDYIALETLDDTIFHFSINWVNEGQAIAGTDEVLAAEQAVLEGEHDAFIDRLADWCSAQRLPILHKDPTDVDDGKAPEAGATRDGGKDPTDVDDGKAPEAGATRDGGCPI